MNWLDFGRGQRSEVNELGLNMLFFGYIFHIFGQPYQLHQAFFPNLSSQSLGPLCYWKWNNCIKLILRSIANCNQSQISNACCDRSQLALHKDSFNQTQFAFDRNSLSIINSCWTSLIHKQQQQQELIHRILIGEIFPRRFPAGRLLVWRLFIVLFRVLWQG